MKSHPVWTLPLHELSICESVLRHVLAVAAARNAEHVGRITLHIGPLAGIEPDLVRLAFPLVAAGTRCEDATLEIMPLSVQVSCRRCGATCEVPPERLHCPICDTWHVDLVSGDQLLLARVELMDARGDRAA